MKRKTNKSESVSQTVKRLRDEAKLQAHLLDVEVKTRLEKWEKDWGTLRSEVKRIIPIAKKAMKQSANASKPLIAQLQDSLQKIEDGFDRHHKTTRSS